MAVRGIKKEFINELKNGELRFFLDKLIAEPDKYVLGIRKNYINIYYRGGNILRIRWHRGNKYSFEFDVKYCKNKDDTSKLEVLSNLNSKNAADFIANFELMRQEMDSWFIKHPKEERGYQQNLLATNDCVIDIEYAIGRSMRLDMLMVTDDTLVIVENKYKTGAIGGKSGVKKHYEDLVKVFDDKDIYDEIIQSVENISNNLYELGLSSTKIDIQKLKHKKILFLLAGYNSKSVSLDKQVDAIKEKKYPAYVLFMDTDEFVIDLDKMQLIIDQIV